MECARTWQLIVNGNTRRMKEHNRSGIVLFYDEFFYRLFQRDKNMEEVFPDVERRSGVLIKAMTFMLKNAEDDDIETVISKCHYLGHRHRSIHKVRAHHFAQYTATVVGKYYG